MVRHLSTATAPSPPHHLQLINAESKEQLDEYSKCTSSVADERRQVDGRPFEQVSEIQLPSKRAQLTLERITYPGPSGFELISSIYILLGFFFFSFFFPARVSALLSPVGTSRTIFKMLLEHPGSSCQNTGNFSRYSSGQGKSPF